MSCTMQGAGNDCDMALQVAGSHRKAGILIDVVSVHAGGGPANFTHVQTS